MSTEQAHLSKLHNVVVGQLPMVEHLTLHMLGYLRLRNSAFSL